MKLIDAQKEMEKLYPGKFVQCQVVSRKFTTDGKIEICCNVYASGFATGSCEGKNFKEAIVNFKKQVELRDEEDG